MDLSARFHAGAVASDVVVLDDDLDRMIASGALECAPVARGSVGRDMRQPHRRAAFRTGWSFDVRKRRIEYVKLRHGLRPLVQAERDWSRWRLKAVPALNLRLGVLGVECEKTYGRI